MLVVTKTSVEGIGIGGKLTGFRDPKKLAPGKALRGGGAEIK